MSGKLHLLVMFSLLILLSACGQQEATFYELSFEQDKILLIDTNKPFSGIYAEYYDSGHQFPKSRIFIKNGVMDGGFYHYYPDGKLREKGTNRNGQYYGYHSLYWPNGKIKQKFFMNRDKAGYNYEYFDDGRIMEMRHYNAQGQLDGKSFTFHRNGQVKDEMNYSNGKREGLFITKDKAGFLVNVFVYRNDILQEQARELNLSDHTKFSTVNTKFYNF
ncbi:toxin-antitoxin system YwqK family antitoxin [Maridesulfovibrio sp.]|uniref:toxin-antitoxin system YwqK family antitoxin n=1 Tax=Maridesulfovibrio sp. TaxID=2795000 RepID=UPI0029F4A0F9|nr:toxin-antitoxin system YwqK family antitoxin [Maridesulfovibrio sp.]